VAVFAVMRPTLFGGALSSWLKALTAARLAEWLTLNELPAIPLLWIDASVRPDDRQVGIRGPDGPMRLALEPSGGASTQIPNAIGALLAMRAGPWMRSLPIQRFFRFLRHPMLPGVTSGTPGPR